MRVGITENCLKTCKLIILKNKTIYYLPTKIKINFVKINYIKNAIQVYGVTDLSHYFSENKAPENKCNIKLDKISTAFLFKLLIEADLIYMDDDKFKSESKIKKFAEKYFNYTDSKLGIKPLTDFTKEYSKVKDKQRKDKQHDVINLLANYIREKRAYLN